MQKTQVIITNLFNTQEPSEKEVFRLAADLAEMSDPRFTAAVLKEYSYELKYGYIDGSVSFLINTLTDKDHLAKTMDELKKSIFTEADKSLIKMIEQRISALKMTIPKDLEEYFPDNLSESDIYELARQLESINNSELTADILKISHHPHRLIQAINNTTLLKEVLDKISTDSIKWPTLINEMILKRIENINISAKEYADVL